MQNAEMEFVTFDAPDIITTSGPLGGFKWFNVTGTGNWSGFEKDAKNTFGKYDAGSGSLDTLWLNGSLRDDRVDAFLNTYKLYQAEMLKSISRGFPS